MACTGWKIFKLYFVHAPNSWALMIHIKSIEHDCIRILKDQCYWEKQTWMTELSGSILTGLTVIQMLMVGREMIDMDPKICGEELIDRDPNVNGMWGLIDRDSNSKGVGWLAVIYISMVGGAWLTGIHISKTDGVWLTGIQTAEWDLHDIQTLALIFSNLLHNHVVSKTRRFHPVSGTLYLCCTGLTVITIRY